MKNYINLSIPNQVVPDMAYELEKITLRTETDSGFLKTFSLQEKKLITSAILVFPAALIGIGQAVPYGTEEQACHYCTHLLNNGHDPTSDQSKGARSWANFMTGAWNMAEYSA